MSTQDQPAPPTGHVPLHPETSQAHEARRTDSGYADAAADSGAPAGSGAPVDSADSMQARALTRSQRPRSEAFRTFISTGWAQPGPDAATRSPAADYAAQRRAALSQRFPGERLVLPAGTLVARANDTDYRFRPDSAFAHLTGLGTDQEPDAVLVLHPDVHNLAHDPGHGPRHGVTHRAVLYLRPPSGRDTDEFFSDARHGEFWVGARPSLGAMAESTGIETADLAELRDALAKDLGPRPGDVQLRVLAQADVEVTAMVDELRRDASTDPEQARARDDQLLETVSELRLVKDAYEVEQMRIAVDATIAGFAQVVRELPRAVDHWRGERVVEGVFGAHARVEGNMTGYETIAAAGSHATTLHWIRNDGQVRPGELILIDAGVEVDSLYTADVTRTLPVDGRFTDIQRRVYQAVLDAADAAFAAAVPGARFRDVHAAAMVVVADRLAGWGLLPVSAEESLKPDAQFHRRWMVHGTSHHLGIDVHDCAQARRELYLDAELAPGMVFTIEPGLYFKLEDLTVPAEYRGIGVRIEDDVVITATGPQNLSAALPRRPEDVEAWMAELLSS